MALNAFMNRCGHIEKPMADTITAAEYWPQVPVGAWREQVLGAFLREPLEHRLHAAVELGGKVEAEPPSEGEHEDPLEGVVHPTPSTPLDST